MLNVTGKFISGFLARRLVPDKSGVSYSILLIKTAVQYTQNL
jgi:hypothetical protein